MTDYIKRSDIANRIDYYESHSVGGEHYAYEVCAREIQNVPTADVAPVIHAKWIENTFCSNCSYYDSNEYGRVLLSGDKNYCPECGAKMDLE